MFFLALLSPNFLWIFLDWWDFWVKYKIFRYNKYGHSKTTDEIRKLLKKQIYECKT